MIDVSLGITREELINILGKPEDTGGTSRKYKTPSVYKYNDIQYFFEPWKSGRLYLVMKYLPDGNKIQIK
jgi:hypothetical protein